MIVVISSLREDWLCAGLLTMQAQRKHRGGAREDSKDSEGSQYMLPHYQVKVVEFLTDLFLTSQLLVEKVNLT
jgi:hypothetical protein